VNRVIFPGKRAGETIFLLFDYTSQLAVGETISSAVVTASVYSGIDASPSSIISGSASISGPVVSQKITAGVLGVIYELLCAATTSTGEVIDLCGALAIIPDLQ
jgi:hypothetical protein